jgi:hypothetical protein
MRKLEKINIIPEDDDMTSNDGTKEKAVNAHNLRRAHEFAADLDIPDKSDSIELTEVMMQALEMACERQGETKGQFISRAIIERLCLLGWLRQKA